MHPGDTGHRDESASVLRSGDTDFLKIYNKHGKIHALSPYWTDGIFVASVVRYRKSFCAGRLFAVEHEGLNQGEAARVVGVDLQAMNIWLKRHRAEGENGLLDGQRVSPRRGKGALSEAEAVHT